MRGRGSNELATGAFKKWGMVNICHSPPEGKNEKTIKKERE